MQEQLIAVSAEDTFCFGCHRGVPCFNQCCADLNQFLYPYDVLRLKNHLGLTSRQFLQQHTSRHVGPASGLPVVSLRPAESDRLACPFVTESGCRVYPDRPASCRMYPLLRTLSRCRSTGRTTERFAILKEIHCRGFESDKQVHVRQWLRIQGLTDYNRFNDKLLDLISLKNRHVPGPLDFKAQRQFHLALYDLDTFRRQLFDEGGYRQVSADSQTLEQARNDDASLLSIGIQWVKDSLFGIRPWECGIPKKKTLESEQAGMPGSDSS